MILRFLSIIISLILLNSSCQESKKNSYDLNKKQDNSKIQEKDSIKSNSKNVKRNSPKEVSDELCYIIKKEHSGFNSAFYEACITGDSIAVKSMIKDGININAKDSNGNTYLMHTVALPHKNGNFDITSILIQHGGQLNHVNFEGKSALTLARTFFNEEGHSPKDENNIRIISTLIRENGGLEQDYIDYIAMDLANRHAEESKKVMKIKKLFQTFYENIEEYEKEVFKLSLEVPSKPSHIVYFKDSCKLKCLQIKEYVKYDHHVLANYMRTKDYYFNSDSLYFYFETLTDFIHKRNQQIRAYYSKNELVVASIKEPNNLESIYDNPNINNLVNVKLENTYRYRFENIINDYYKDIEFIKTQMKIDNKGYSTCLN